ncbi:MAG: hypothetical protein ACPLRN_01915 [Microgenomates group bacterium]
MNVFLFFFTVFSFLTTFFGFLDEYEASFFILMLGSVLFFIFKKEKTKIPQLPTIFFLFFLIFSLISLFFAYDKYIAIMKFLTYGIGFLYFLIGFNYKKNIGDIYQKFLIFLTPLSIGLFYLLKF